MKTKIDIFSGFLGAGKTMLIKKLLEDDCYKDNVVIIENEFGEIGIDGFILQESNIKVREITAGCICCSVTNDFNESISEIIKKYSPNRIVIEPSGVAKLSEILDICKKHELKNLISINMVVTVIDISRFNMYITNFNDFYKNQIINAKTIVLTRTDNINDEELLSYTNKLQSLNPKTSIISANWNDIKSSEIIEIAENSLENLLTKKMNLLKPNGKKIIPKLSTKTTTNKTFQSFSIEINKTISRENLLDILNKFNEYTKYGNILRAKGFIKTPKKNWIQFDYVPEEISLKTTSANTLGKICIIGTNLNKSELRSLF